MDSVKYVPVGGSNLRYERASTVVALYDRQGLFSSSYPCRNLGREAEDCDLKCRCEVLDKLRRREEGR
jgi:hypothetical protein